MEWKPLVFSNSLKQDKKSWLSYLFKHEKILLLQTLYEQTDSNIKFLVSFFLYCFELLKLHAAFSWFILQFLWYLDRKVTRKNSATN